jgi:hypothetical protein
MTHTFASHLCLPSEPVERESTHKGSGEQSAWCLIHNDVSDEISSVGGRHGGVAKVVIMVWDVSDVALRHNLCYGYVWDV